MTFGKIYTLFDERFAKFCKLCYNIRIATSKYFLSEKEMFPMNKEAKNRPLVLKNLEVVGLTNYQRMALTQLELKNREKEHSEK